MRIAIAVLSACVTTQPALAQQTVKALTLEGYLKDDYAMMRDFGRCSALMEHTAKFLEKNGKPANAEEMRGYARGARVVADLATTLKEALTMKDDASEAELRDSQKRIATKSASLSSIIELETVRQRAFAERGELDTDMLTFCVQLNPVQKTIIEGLRRDGFFGQ